MYESAHSPSVEEFRDALRRLDAAWVRHARLLAEGGGPAGMAGVLRRELDLMREEAARLRELTALKNHLR